ncbi:putative amino acid ABC transporter permease protein (plasmid) [Selenomonas ruminantium subsp. lactilytica TAM6421]|uniref:Putative amino acid ABC transporter permease protein n=1 Tax=Selenomonas ruminantium subsp. lactilytica (strain NBRC 103574 / TAM6421) TaxID=927704 RepID=I0GWB7_SELRL|nr:amino acid ABC transporter permease [Selenomonas ruminantium]BAL85054.1 putative amino acid ABC transporter permease protein [Selenomonas ruminantium subsp. lactilytica TAM6421]
MNANITQLHFDTAGQILLPSLLHGAGLVIETTLLGFLLALVVGTFIAVGRLFAWRPFRAMLYTLLELVRGTPLLVQLVYIYYVVPLLINLIAGMCGYHTDVQISPLTAGIAGLALNYGCYMSEVIRGSILAVDKGQTEAALCLGFGEMEALFRLILPQAVRSIIPALGNYLVMMIKDTSLLAYVAVNELLLRTQTFASQTFLTIEAYTYLALAYLILSLPLSRCVKFLEYKLSESRG